MEPVITSKAAAIISQCGNPNDATAAFLRESYFYAVNLTSGAAATGK